MRIISAVIFLVACWTASAGTIHGKVVGVSDGDTVTVLDAENSQFKIRLSGIDAPEKKQAFGQASKAALSDDIYDKVVEVSYTKRDRYGRIVGKIFVDGEDVNIRQINRGLAWHYKKYQNEQPHQDREAYSQAEATARAGKRGLWADHDPTPPWYFRHPNQ